RRGRRRCRPSRSPGRRTPAEADSAGPPQAGSRWRLRSSRTAILTRWVEAEEVDADLRALKERLAEISDLSKAGGVLAWDQKVVMPPGGHPARAEALATVGRIAHEKFVDAEIGHLLDRLRPLEESLDYDSDDASLIRI